jgi:multisubunit Na+/H+ antiporter MnhB subunit
MISFVALLLLQLEEPTSRYVGGGVAKGAVIIVTSIMMYVLPTLLAFRRDRQKKWKIAAINLLLGWTLIGWVVSMLMTYAYEPPRDGEPPDTERVPGTPRF